MLFLHSGVDLSLKSWSKTLFGMHDHTPLKTVYCVLNRQNLPFIKNIMGYIDQC